MERGGRHGTQIECIKIINYKIRERKRDGGGESAAMQKYGRTSSRVSVRAVAPSSSRHPHIARLRYFHLLS